MNLCTLLLSAKVVPGQLKSANMLLYFDCSEATNSPAPKKLCQLQLARSQRDSGASHAAFRSSHLELPRVESAARYRLPYKGDS